MPHATCNGMQSIQLRTDVFFPSEATFRLSGPPGPSSLYGPLIAASISFFAGTWNQALGTEIMFAG